MKNSTLCALFGILLFCSCETNLQSSQELFTAEEEIIESPENEADIVHAFHLDKMEGSSICSALSANFLASNQTSNTQYTSNESYKTSGDFTTHNGLIFKFSAAYANGKVRGSGSIDFTNDPSKKLRYNIISMAAADNNVIFQGIIMNSENFSEKYALGNSIVFNLEDNGSQISDRYNAAFYAFGPDMNTAFYDAKVWMDCGEDCFPESYFVTINDGVFQVN